MALRKIVDFDVDLRQYQTAFGQSMIYSGPERRHDRFGPV